MRISFTTLAYFLVAWGLLIAQENSNLLLAQTIQWAESIEKAKERAVAENKPILLHFGADYCSPCRSLEQFVFTEPRVAQAVNDRFVAVKVDTKKHPELAEQYQVTRIPHDVILTSTGQVAYRRMSPSSASLYQEMLVTSSRIAAETSPRSQQVVEAMSGFTQVQREEQAQSPFYGEQAALAGSVGAWPSGNQSVSQFDGTLPPATVRPSAAVAPGEFGNGSNLQRQGPSHQLAEKNFPVAEYQSREALPEVSSPFPNRGPSANAASAGQLPAASQLPPAGQLPAPEIAANANLAVSPTAAAQATRPQPHHSVNAFYQESEAAATGHATRKVPTTIPPDHQVQQANANVVPESAPVGLEGFCPVTLLSGQKWVKGDQGVGCIHRGVLYLFADQAALERFMTSPDQWSPMLGGFDPVIMEQENRLQPGKRRFGVFCETVPGQSAIILFENESNRERFKQDSERYLKLIRDVTAKADRR